MNDPIFPGASFADEVRIRSSTENNDTGRGVRTLCGDLRGDESKRLRKGNKESEKKIAKARKRSTVAIEQGRDTRTKHCSGKTLLVIPGSKRRKIPTNGVNRVPSCPFSGFRFQNVEEGFSVGHGVELCSTILYRYANEESCIFSREAKEGI